MKNHLKSALDSIRRSPFQAVAAIMVLFLTFLEATVLIIAVYSSSKLITFYETRPQIIAFLKNDAKQTEISDLQNKLSVDTRVKNIKYVSKEEALAIYKESTADKPLLGELVSPAIFPADLEFSVTDLQYADKIMEELKSNPIVESIGFTASIGKEKDISLVVSRLKNISLYLRVGGLTLVALQGLTSLFVLFIIIGFRMTARKDEIDVLKLIGATAGFIRVPVIIESLIYTFIGLLLGWTTTLIIVLYSLPSITAYFKDASVLPKDPLGLLELFGVVLLAESAVAVVLALLGSMLAISRAKTR